MDDLVKWLSIGYRFSLTQMDRVFAPYGFSGNQCLYIARVCEHPGITQDRFLQLFYVNPSNVTRAIAALEKEGFLERRRSAKDKRTFCLFPTERSLAVYDEIIAQRRRWQETLLSAVPEENREIVLDGLQKLALCAVEETEKEAEEYGES